eukprot:COSAG01_NODE_32279_length_583_cov_5.382231_1_plen_160_part_01
MHHNNLNLLLAHISTTVFMYRSREKAWAKETTSKSDRQLQKPHWLRAHTAYRQTATGRPHRSASSLLGVARILPPTLRAVETLALLDRAHPRCYSPCCGTATLLLRMLRMAALLADPTERAAAGGRTSHAPAQQKSSKSIKPQMWLFAESLLAPRGRSTE